MNQETLAERSGSPVIDGDLVHPVGCSGARHAVQALSGSLTTQPQVDIPQPVDASRPMQSHDQEAPEQDLSRMTATYDSHYLKIDRDTGFRVANARRHPQNTHAHATSCLMYTCAHRWCR